MHGVISIFCMSANAITSNFGNPGPFGWKLWSCCCSSRTEVTHPQFLEFKDVGTLFRQDVSASVVCVNRINEYMGHVHADDSQRGA